MHMKLVTSLKHQLYLHFANVLAYPTANLQEQAQSTLNLLNETYPASSAFLCSV